MKLCQGMIGFALFSWKCVIFLSQTVSDLQGNKYNVLHLAVMGNYLT